MFVAKSRETLAVEASVPAHMMFLMMEQCQKAGIEGRDDFLHKLNVAAAGPLAGLDMLSVSRAARRVDDAANRLLHDLSPDDPVEGLHACAMFALVLANEGLLADPGCQAVLVSMLLIEDAKTEHPTEKGVVRVDEERWQRAAKKMLHRARALSLYLS